MTEFDFDQLTDRRHTASLKYDRYAGADILPMWVADMDFQIPPAVRDALHRRVDHGIFGYPVAPPELADIVVDRLNRHYRWHVSTDSLVWLPGLVTGLNVACRTTGRHGDQVITTTPIYPPFLSAPVLSDRQVVTSKLCRDGHRWVHDLADIERQITPRTSLFMLCSPHNPTGRAWDRQELLDLAQLCLRHQVVICSDEIHCELVLDPDKPHFPIAALSEEIADQTITLMAPSKTFNIPGLACSFAVIPNAELRQKFVAVKTGIVPGVNVLGYTAAQAAFSDTDDWRQALLAYLRQNRDQVADVIKRMPGHAMDLPEATYLAWIDTRRSGIPDPAQFYEQAGVGLSDGSEFNGPGYLRLNFGCPRALLQKALQRMLRAVENL